MIDRSLVFLSIGAALLGVGTAVSYFAFTADDAYIVLRYASNVWTHGELVFNPGEPVTTLTSPLHGLLAAVLYGAAGESAIQMNKALMTMLVGVSVWLLMRGKLADLRAWALVLTIVFASPFIWMWAVGGLETMLVVCVITAIAALYTSADRGSAFIAINALAGVAFLARYDTVFFVLPVLLGLWSRTGRDRGLSTLAIGMCVSAALPLIWLAFSAYYFHDIFPTSFYAKATRDITLFKIGYLGQFLLITGVGPLWLLAFVRGSRAGGGRLRAALWDRWPMLLGLALVFAYGSAHATVHMMFGYRLLLPYLGALVLVGLDLLALNESGRKRPSADRAVALLASAVLAIQLVQAVTVYTRSLGGVGLTGEFRDMSLSAYAGDYLPVMDAGCRDVMAHARNVPKFDMRSPRFVTFAEGYIPYCDRTLYVLGHLVSYRRGVNEQFPPARVFQESADYIYVLAPRHGTVAEQLPLPVEQFEVVSSHTIEYDGRDETFAIYFNPRPRAALLPRYVH